MSTEKTCLREHVDPAADYWQECDAEASKPVSSVDQQEMLNWLEERKKVLKPMEDDVKDAKRRITAAKGPKKKSAVAAADDASEAESSAGGSA